MADVLDKPLSARIGNYVLVRRIGRGTHYTLYQAADARAGRMVLIKALHVPPATVREGDPLEPDALPNAPEADREPARVLAARLQREGRALGRLSHPNVVAIHETSEEEGFPYLVMEYLYGHPLRQHLDQRALSLEETLGILEQVAAGVDAVHAEGILHRDLRPSNVMIQHDGQVKLINFGLARQPGDVTVTLMGEMVGEPAYMAPEQLRNQPASPESDLWALGVLLYEMLAGQPPFQGSSFPLTAHQVIMGTPPPVPGASRAVQAVVDRALEKDPAKRYRQAREMVEELRKAVGGHVVGGFSVPPLSLADPLGLTFSTQPVVLKKYALAGAIAIGLAASLLIGVHLLPSLGGEPTPVAAESQPATKTTSPTLLPVSSPSPSAVSQPIKATLAPPR